MNYIKTITFVILSAVIFNSCQENAKEKTVTKTEVTSSNIVEKSYKLKGFTKSCCAGIVEFSLKEVQGYLKSEAHVNDQKIKVWFDNTKCKEIDIKKAINNTTYTIIE